jgi:hypothetical protein
MKTIQWDNNIDTTNLRSIGLLYVEPSIRSWMNDYYKISNNDLPIYSLSYEEIVARLYNISNQDIFNNVNFKLSFIVHGTFNDIPFILYDYKGLKLINIASTKELIYDDFINVLSDSIIKAKPKRYVAKIRYSILNGSTYKYP